MQKKHHKNRVLSGLAAAFLWIGLIQSGFAQSYQIDEVVDYLKSEQATLNDFKQAILNEANRATGGEVGSILAEVAKTYQSVEEFVKKRWPDVDWAEAPNIGNNPLSPVTDAVTGEVNTLLGRIKGTDVYNKIETGWTCFWNVNISHLPNVSPYKAQFRDLLILRQMTLAEQFKNAAITIHKMDPRIPQKKTAEAKLDAAAGSVSAFMCVNVQENIEGSDGTGYRAGSEFLQKEERAKKDVLAASTAIVTPAKVGAVPEGDLINDFIPQLIRLAFQFASIAVLIAFIVSGVMLVMVYDNEERVTKAKTMLYYSLVGFAFVALAFAVVKAITNIDFFSFL